jgi:periplasmic divalent cation tolerance protein
LEDKVSEYILVLTTVPEKKSGQEIAQVLVGERLAACVTVSGVSESSYWWKDKISQDQEYILFIKTRGKLYSQVEEKILEIHPYEVPEIIALPLIQGYKKYLDWISQETKV